MIDHPPSLARSHPLSHMRAVPRQPLPTSTRIISTTPRIRAAAATHTGDHPLLKRCGRIHHCCGRSPGSPPTPSACHSLALLPHGGACACMTPSAWNVFALVPHGGFRPHGGTCRCMAFVGCVLGSPLHSAASPCAWCWLCAQSAPMRLRHPSVHKAHAWSPPASSMRVSGAPAHAVCAGRGAQAGAR